MKKALQAIIFLILLFKGSSFAEEWSPYKKVLIQKSINYCLFLEGFMTEKDARMLDKHFLIDKGGLSEVQVNNISQSISDRNDDFVKKNGGCKNILDAYGRTNLIWNGVIPKKTTN